MVAMRRMGRAVSLVLGTGYCLYFFSETVFWSLWRADSDLPTHAATVLVYSFLGYMLMALIAALRVRDCWTLLVAGACFGWVNEGVFAMTMFGASGLPLPFTISWTALAWHAPLSVLVGWWWLGRALRAPRPWRALQLSVAIGLFWAGWGYGWQFEAPPVLADPGDFFANALAATLLLALAQAAMSWGAPDAFRPSRVGVALTGIATLAFFGAVTVPHVPIAPLILLPLLALSVLALRRAGRSVPADAPSLLADFAAPVRVLNAAMLAVIPLLATAIYAMLIDARPDVQMQFVVLGVSSLAGTALFAVGLWRIFRRRVLEP